MKLALFAMTLLSTTALAGPRKAASVPDADVERMMKCNWEIALGEYKPAAPETVMGTLKALAIVSLAPVRIMDMNPTKPGSTSIAFSVKFDRDWAKENDLKQDRRDAATALRALIDADGFRAGCVPGASTN